LRDVYIEVDKIIDNAHNIIYNIRKGGDFMPQVNVNIRMDKEIKEQADSLFNELGFNLTTAVNAFVRQALRERAIPFYIKADTPARGREELFSAVRAIQEEAVANGTDKLTMEEINAEIATYRLEKEEK